MTDLRQAAQQALEALELSAVTVDSFGVQKATQAAITALRTALEQQQVGPVEDMMLRRAALRSAKIVFDGRFVTKQAEPLTDEQADQIIGGLKTCHHQSSKREFLKVWLRDWAAHNIKEQL